MTACTRPELAERLVELLGANPPAPALGELVEHVTACASCAAELEALNQGYDALGALQPAAPSPSVLLRARQAGLGAGAAGTRGRLTAAAAVGVAVSAIFVAAKGMRADLVHHALGLAAMPVLALAYVLGLRAVARLKLLDPAFLVTTAVGLGLGLAVPAGPGLPVPSCFALTLGLTLLPLGVALSALPSGPRAQAAGAVAGAATSLIAFAALRAHCPADGMRHFLISHLPAVPAAALAGAGLARLVIVLRRKRATDTTA